MECVSKDLRSVIVKNIHAKLLDGRLNVISITNTL